MSPIQSPAMAMVRHVNDAVSSDLLPVNEIFQTIQGEAKWTGTPSIFLRLQGCDVGCPWCDTKHTWAVDPADVIPLDSVVSKTGDAQGFAMASVAELVAIIRKFDARHVVITGGEPCIHNLVQLTAAILAIGRTVQIETSGTEPIRVSRFAWVTLSPKIGMPGGKIVRVDAIRRANELKIPVGKLADIEASQWVIDALVDGTRVWLQPLSASPKATALCIAEATRHGWAVSIQTHKFIGVR